MINYAQLLNREPFTPTHGALSAALEGKTVLITGGGGSIGSELALLVMDYSPKKLIIADRCEGNLFNIGQRLEIEGKIRNVALVIADVCDASNIGALFESKVDIVFHAAAYKHVPLLEDCFPKAYFNNVIGTEIPANEAIKTGAGKFVMISTDKAVNPKSIMGQTKRSAEKHIQSKSDSDTDFSIVRFGNVIGSSGSVTTIWDRQIAAGKPITVTDPNMTRYFITLREAAMLVLHTVTMEGNGDVFLLDMGEPINMLDLAKDYLAMVGSDAEIKIIGTRPGEKVHEELHYANEQKSNTQYDKIWRLTREVKKQNDEAG